MVAKIVENAYTSSVYLDSIGDIICAIVGMKINMPLLFDEGCAALPLYVAGKFLYPYVRKLMTSKSFLIVGMMALLAFCCKYTSFTIVPQANGVFAPFYVVALFVMLLAFLPFLYVSSKLQGLRWLDSLGQHSLGIMLLHAPMCHTAAVVLNRVFVVGTLSWVGCFLIAYVVIVALAYWLTVVIERHCPGLLGK